MKAYYQLIDDCAHSPVWQRKIEEEIGQNIAMLVIAFDESVRDALVDNSELFTRFVSLKLSTNRLVYRTRKSRSSSNEITMELIRTRKLFKLNSCYIHT